MESGIFSLEGRIAVVTGGGGVLCRRMAKELGSRGATVAVLDIRADAAAVAAEEVVEAGGQAIGVECDVLDRPSLEHALACVEDRFGTPNILINGAGGNHPRATTADERLAPSPSGSGSFFGLDPEGIQFVFSLNFLGTMLPSQVFGQRMAEAGGGTIVNVSSMSAFRPLTKIAAYSAAKAAVSNFTQWLAVHLAPAGIRVNALAPGFFLTDQNRFLLTSEATGELTERGSKILGHTPMSRFGEPGDLTGTLVWLCSEASAFVTGVVVPVDGGFSAYGGV